MKKLSIILLLITLSAGINHAFAQSGRGNNSDWKVPPPVVPLSHAKQYSLPGQVAPIVTPPAVPVVPQTDEPSLTEPPAPVVPQAPVKLSMLSVKSVKPVITMVSMVAPQPMPRVPQIPKLPLIVSPPPFSVRD